MYTQIKNVQFLVQLLKEHNVKHIVLSPGARNIPVAHSVEEDDFFTCYSVVDERSAAYFAIGLSQELGNEIVAICCTSSVAASNYLPGVTEAFYLNVPLLVITCDRNPRYLDQRENQMINQVDMYKNFCKKCVNLPLVEADEDEWYCQRLINEALLELKHHGNGPVQINVPVASGLGLFQSDPLPSVTKIDRLEYGRTPEKWAAAKEKLALAKKIMIICGQQIKPNSETLSYMEKFAKKYNCLFATEHISNISIEGSLDIFGACAVIPLAEFDSGHYLPDIVITIGGNFVSRIKDILKLRFKKFEHFSISEDGKLVDVFKSLTTVFECTDLDFFKYFVENAPSSIKNNNEYRKLWENYVLISKFPYLEYSNSYAIKKLSENIPENSIMHMGILNATRIMQHCTVANNIESYSNVGAFGIDGSMSTFMGQSVAAPNKLAFCILGDLSFFYDMNSLQIKHIGKNVRIFLINNSGAAEFHFFMGKEKIPTIDWHIAAEHHTQAEGWVRSRGFNYYRATNKDEFDENLKKFVAESDVPQVFEVITEKDKDADILKAFYSKFKKISVTQKIENKKDSILKKIFK